MFIFRVSHIEIMSLLSPIYFPLLKIIKTKAFILFWGVTFRFVFKRFPEGLVRDFFLRMMWPERFVISTNNILQFFPLIHLIYNMKNTADRSFGVLTYSLLSFICSLTFSCGIFIVAPFSMNDDSENLHSSLALLLVVVTTYVGTGIILSHIGEHKI